MYQTDRGWIYEVWFQGRVVVVGWLAPRLQRPFARQNEQ